VCVESVCPSSHLNSDTYLSHSVLNTTLPILLHKPWGGILDSLFNTLHTVTLSTLTIITAAHSWTHLFCCFRIVWIFVRMILKCQSPISLLYIICSGSFGKVQDLVKWVTSSAKKNIYSFHNFSSPVLRKITTSILNLSTWWKNL
jgi:hypothetical protein